MVIKATETKSESNFSKCNDLIVKDLPFEGYLDPVNFIENKRKHYMKNNIFNEIERIKQKESQNNFNYLKIMRVTQSEYEKSQILACTELEKLTPNHVNEILSTKKLLHIERNIIEILNYLIGNFYFHWESFKEKINYFELKYKMENIDYDKLNPDTINKFLNKISSKKEFESDYLRENFSPGFILFNWIKCIMKIFLYKYQNKLLNYQGKSKEMISHHSNNDSNINKKKNKHNSISLFNNNLDQSLYNHGNNLTSFGVTLNSIRNVKNSELVLNNYKNDLKKQTNLKKENDLNIPVISNLNKEYETKNVSIFSKETSKNLNESNFLSQTNGTGYHLKKRFIDKEKENFYLTNIKYQSRQPLKPLKKNIGSLCNDLSNTGIKDQQLKIDFDIVQDKKLQYKKNMQDIPLLYVRTFGQLRKYFHSRKGNSSIIRDKHFDDIRNISLRDSNNTEILLKFISKGKIISVDNDIIENFIEKK